MTYLGRTVWFGVPADYDCLYVKFSDTMKSLSFQTPTLPSQPKAENVFRRACKDFSHEEGFYSYIIKDEGFDNLLVKRALYRTNESTSTRTTEQVATVRMHKKTKEITWDWFGTTSIPEIEAKISDFIDKNLNLLYHQVVREYIKHTLETSLYAISLKKIGRGGVWFIPIELEPQFQEFALKIGTDLKILIESIQVPDSALILIRDYYELHLVDDIKQLVSEIDSLTDSGKAVVDIQTKIDELNIMVNYYKDIKDFSDRVGKLEDLLQETIKNV